MRGRPPKPMQLLEMSGAVKKNPQRYRGRAAATAVTAAGIGDPPTAWLDGAKINPRLEALVALWNEIVAQDILHVLNVSHRTLVENTCYLMYKIRRANAGLAKATSGDSAQLVANLARMGMTPVDSARVAEAVRVPDRGNDRAKKSGGGWGELVG